jgi:hypothetical protein
MTSDLDELLTALDHLRTTPRSDARDRYVDMVLDQLIVLGDA